jgi:hypothetical protein
MMITAPCCIANGCPAPASYHGGGGWVCAAHRYAPAERWFAVTAWNSAHEWAYTAAAFAEWISSVEWRDLADRTGARIVQHGYPTWAPCVVRIEQSAFDRVTGAATVTVRERDEREHGRFWAYRLRRELLAECLRACGCVPGKDVGEAGGQTIEPSTPQTATSLAKIAAAGLDQFIEHRWPSKAAEAAGEPILAADNPSG